MHCDSGCMENSSFRLLAKDGHFVATFTPSLTPEQYADLVQIVTSDADFTKAQLCEKFIALATAWEVRFESDPICD